MVAARGAGHHRAGGHLQQAGGGRRPAAVRAVRLVRAGRGTRRTHGRALAGLPDPGGRSRRHERLGAVVSGPGGRIHDGACATVVVPAVAVRGDPVLPPLGRRTQSPVLRLRLPRAVARASVDLGRRHRPARAPSGGGAAAAWWWRRRNPLVPFAVLGSLAVLLPTSSVLPLLDAYVEHRLYLPIALLGLLAVAAAFATTEALAHRLPGSRTAIHAGRVVVAVAACAALGLATIARNRVYADPLRLWEDSVSTAPESSRAQYNLANLYLARGDYERPSRTIARPSARTPSGSRSLREPRMDVHVARALRRDDRHLSSRPPGRSPDAAAPSEPGARLPAHAAAGGCAAARRAGRGAGT